jgi:hypothetical protein
MLLSIKESIIGKNKDSLVVNKFVLSFVECPLSLSNSIEGQY